jgi:hypothetical protein
VSQSTNWLDLIVGTTTSTALSVSLGGCASTGITVALKQTVAATFAAGNYLDVITFSNATAATVLDTRSANLTVGGLFFCDDFSTFVQNTDLEGQQGWVAASGNPALQVTNNAVYNPASLSAIDEPYKNIPLTSNNVALAYYALQIVVTSAPAVTVVSPSRGPIFWTQQNGSGFARDWLSARDTGTGTFVFCIRKNAAGNNYVFGTNALVYGTKYNVIMETDPGTDLYMALYVNPASACLTTNNAYAVAKNVGAIDPNIGSFSLQSQFTSATDPSPGYAVYKVCITTNCTDAFNDITTTGPSDPYVTWTSAYSLSGGNAAGGADPDGDGMINTNEFLAGFDPNDNAARLRIISITRTNSNNDIRVDYLGASGDNSYTGGPASRTNVLEFTAGTGPSGSYSNNFASTGVTQVLSGGNGSGTLANMVDPGGATNKPARYYRVRVIVP